MSKDKFDLIAMFMYVCSIVVGNIIFYDYNMWMREKVSKLTVTMYLYMPHPVLSILYIIIIISFYNILILL